MISPKARALIVAHESLNQPWHWPGGESGITLGWGYELAHAQPEEFRRDWGRWLAPTQIGRLARAIGRSGPYAKALAPGYRDISITIQAADAVFDGVSLPKYEAQAARAFPNLDALPADARGALVSLVYNRGPKLTGDRRREMAEIRRVLADGVQRGDLQKIADQLRAMKRLWQGQGLGGLLTRREDEARLVESCIPLAERRTA